MGEMPMTESSLGWVLVQVVPAENRREISWGSNKVQNLADRVQGIKAACAFRASAVADSLTTLPRAPGWRVGEVSETFGLSLAAEAGVILMKASAETTFEVTVTFECAERSSLEG
jgi:hypothetical protein